MVSHQQGRQLTDEQWQAITHNDVKFDEIFIYAVKSTGIFCRPSCKSRNPKKENVHIFNDANEAIAEGFRPCKRCKPGGLRLPDEEFAMQIGEYIDEHYCEPLTLEILADMCHGSPYHLQRTYKKVTGLTPVEYIQKVRISKAMYELITTNKSVAEIGLSVGLPNPSYFITLFKLKIGQTPKQYRKTAMEVQINGEEQ
jgi:AraC family transcriptional regulator of adaptative response / methylphosphotriester-DNA alkyltransferase methyltransferase